MLLLRLIEAGNVHHISDAGKSSGTVEMQVQNPASFFFLTAKMKFFRDVTGINTKKYDCPMRHELWHLLRTPEEEKYLSGMQGD